MKGLLRKDLYLMIKYCRLFFILIIVFSFAGAWNNNLFFALYPITISSIIPVNLLSYDEKSNWSLYACTFPCSRKEIVSSKYITATCLYVSVYLQTRCWERSVCLLYWIYFIFRIAWLVAIFHKKFASRTCTFPFPKLLYFDSFFHRFITVYDFLDSIHKILSEQGILTSL